ncbi:DUF881 domain-containing protein [Actinacidiphila acididurans]|uniref:DUF881 domain-containing protein n=1 Tax=Actinacidiphila acididurans TaxID=2784346 RepID=A0ABS2U316_9ACTN|nr:DUF881 domain-containing protein [Actinacidiphila acididurans]MBM9509141.1 DUF881 domain-containing protein [Actinacidiphila acididurans]
MSEEHDHPDRPPAAATPEPEPEREPKAVATPESRPAAEPAPEPAAVPEPRPAPEPAATPAAKAVSAPEPGPQAPAAPEPAEPAAAAPSGRQRLLAGLWPPRLSRAQLTVAVLLFALGLGLAIQVRSTSDNSALRGARQEDLVRILTELDNRGQRLQDEKRGLENQRTQLETSSDQAAEALKQTRQKARELGVLAGTVAAQGPGITLTITDPHGGVEADTLLDTLQELRAAGAEAIQINDVRVVADTYFTQGADGVRIDGHKVTQPYRFKVIGSPQDLEPALNIPGGVVQTLEKQQATADVVRSQKIVVDALRPSEQPDYARSSR